MALTQAVKESIRLQAILWDLGARRHLEELWIINIDNQGALALAKNPLFYAHTKPIDTQYHFVLEQVDNQPILLYYCPTADMTADIFTKALPEPVFVKHNLALGLIDHSAFTLTVSRNIEDNLGYGIERSTGEGWSC